MPSRGSQDPRWQRWIPAPQVIGRVASAGDDSPGKISHIRVPMPDSRLRVKISILFIGDPGQAIGSAPLGTLWLYETDDDLSGGSGNLGEQIPLTDIVGTSLVPIIIPASVDLRGYSREFVSAADYIEGDFTILDHGLTGRWILQARYQPQSVAFTAEEWGIITAQCTPHADTVTVP